VGLRFNPPPGWPPVPEGFTPQPGWQPDPSWPPPPPGWQLWVSDDQPPADTSATTEMPQVTSQMTQPTPTEMPTAPPLPSYTANPQNDNPNPAFTAPDASYGAPGTPGYGAPGAPYAAPGYGAPGYGTPGPYGAPYGYGTPPPGSGKTSGWAIAALIFGILGGVLLSVIFAFIALSRIKRLGQRGRGMAIASLVLSGLWIIVIVLAIIGANTNKPTRSASTGQITHSGKINVFSLQVGDCFDNPVNAQSVNDVTAIPCNQPHNAQIFAKFKLTGSDFSYPGTAQVTKLATNGCNSRTGSVDKSMTTSAMGIRLLFPQESSWITGQRTVSCMIVNPTANLTSSLLNP
jgi:Domain of unknown function (DUF4190)/Septum formation